MLGEGVIPAVGELVEEGVFADDDDDDDDDDDEEEEEEEDPLDLVEAFVDDNNDVEE